METDETPDERRERYRKRRNTPIEDVIAETKFIAVVGTERREVVLQIGRPYLVDDQTQCPVASWGIHGRYPDMIGMDSFGALIAAVKLLQADVENWVTTWKAHIYFTEDETEEFPISLILGTMSIDEIRAETARREEALKIPDTD